MNYKQLLDTADQSGLIRTYEAGCHNLYEVAEYLDDTEEYVQVALQCYRTKYGVYAIVDNYTIFFEPSFAVMKMIYNHKTIQQLRNTISLLEY